MLQRKAESHAIYSVDRAVPDQLDVVVVAPVALCFSRRFDVLPNESPTGGGGDVSRRADFERY